MTTKEDEDLKDAVFREDFKRKQLIKYLQEFDWRVIVLENPDFYRPHTVREAEVSIRTEENRERLEKRKLKQTLEY